MVGRHVVRAVASSPEEPFSQIFAALLSAIAHAENEVSITNAYFAPDPQLISALTDASRKGVAIKLLLPSKTDSLLVFHAGRSHYEGLLEAGVRIFERRSVILHSKTALIDGVWATVGSTNMDWRSLLHNYELNVIVLGSEFGKQMRTSFETDLSQSDEITLQNWRSRPMTFKMLEGFSRVWEYWL